MQVPTCKEYTYLGGSGSWRAGSLDTAAATAEAVDEEDDDLVTGRAPGATGSGLGDLYATIDWRMTRFDLNKGRVTLTYRQQMLWRC